MTTRRRTSITFDRKASDPGADGVAIGTFRSATMFVEGDDVVLENLTVENAAGPVGQAVALRLDGDRIIVRNSRLLGWQDTLLVNRGRHYFEDTFIAGHVDFIFGAGTVVFLALSRARLARRLSHGGVDAGRSAVRSRVRRQHHHRGT